MKLRFLLYFTTFLSFFSCWSAKAETLVGRVVRVADGDTVEILPENGSKLRIRFQGIDAPELSQPFGKESRTFLKSLIEGKVILVKVEKTDRYGRIVGRIWLPREGKKPLDVEEKILDAGMAWHYAYFNHEKKLARAQQNARNAKRGLWANPDAIPPWKWREMHPRR